MKKKAVLMIVSLVVVVGVILGLTVFKNNKNGIVKYRQEALAKGDVEALVVTTGTLNPVSLVEVGSQVSGKIANIYVDFNSQVKEGQVLAELDQSILKARIEENRANYLSAAASLEGAKVTLDNLKKKYDRALSLFDKKLISFDEKESAEAAYLGAKTEVQSAEARVEQAKSQLESSKVDLAYAIIRSPIDGLVILRNINIGQTVAASFQAPVLFKIANDLNKMQVECSVDEADIGRVKEGQKVRFTVDAFPDETFQGTVRQVRYSPEIQQNVVTYTTIAEVINPGLKLRPGMTATVSIIAGEAKNVLRIPNAALRFTPNLPPEEIQAIMKEAGAKTMARREEGRQTPETGGGDEARRSNPSTSSGQRYGSGPDARALSSGENAASQGGRKPPAHVWVLDKTGKIDVVFVRTGVSDSSFTEMLKGNLQEGQEVIVGIMSASEASAQAQRPQQGGQRMMFIGH